MTAATLTTTVAPDVITRHVTHAPVCAGDFAGHVAGVADDQAPIYAPCSPACTALA